MPNIIHPITLFHSVYSVSYTHLNKYLTFTPCRSKQSLTSRSPTDRQSDKVFYPTHDKEETPLLPFPAVDML